jgi:SET domain-containing protein
MKSKPETIRKLTEQDVENYSRLYSISEFPEEYKRPSMHKNCEIRHSQIGGNGLFATASIESGEVILASDGEKFNMPVVYSYQIDDDIHTMGLGALNHECDPNCGIDEMTSNIVTLRAIVAGEELSFNYLTTEFDMASPFLCKCGSSQCYSYISGFSNLAKHEKERLIQMLPIATYLRDSINPM